MYEFMKENDELLKDMTMVEDVPGYHEYRVKYRKLNSKYKKLLRVYKLLSHVALIGFIVGLGLSLLVASSFDYGLEGAPVHTLISGLSIGGSFLAISGVSVIICNKLNYRIYKLSRKLANYREV